MLRFVICEDNKDFLDRMANIINKIMMPYNFDYKVNKFTKYNEKFGEIIRKEYEQKIYILDIELSDVSGLEIASEIREYDLESTIIFVTSHNEFKSDIFYSRLIATDYIFKDRIWADRFENTIRYIVKSINKKRVLAFEFNYNSYRIPFNNILYIEKVSDIQKCIINTETGEQYEVITTLNNLLELLGPNFYQTHKSCVVNLDKVKRINYAKNTITFMNGECLYLLSNRKKKELREYVSKY